MESLTKAEEKVMQVLWKLGKAFVKDIIEHMDEQPKPPYTTISSIVRILESKGFVGYKAYGKTHEYFPVIQREEYSKRTLRQMITDYFDGSAANVMSFLVREEKLGEAEIEALKKLIEKS
ncbi:BlaI/MecI/CopY family transcriptional regulator [Chitinophaga horti]|uniref:BlaI/MecI/CopY family transcriptional regulator n=1 Tax=Chitinophaga horti TaxID=2920382 RepID=A0ABY6J322_9BACT|nr:BlaI/MecI/CopY family transcriptional regulator [Chitinophaga horti]UYQ93037.1 BlaI/MecI/CopY family transcriptional regulator [Chitinophaga horti]